MHLLVVFLDSLEERLLRHGANEDVVCPRCDESNARCCERANERGVDAKDHAAPSSRYTQVVANIMAKVYIVRNDRVEDRSQSIRISREQQQVTSDGVWRLTNEHAEISQHADRPYGGTRLSEYYMSEDLCDIEVI